MPKNLAEIVLYLGFDPPTVCTNFIDNVVCDIAPKAFMLCD